jgi:hypothetical protein
LRFGGRLFAQEPFPEWFVPWFVAGTLVFFAIVVVWAVRQRRR